MLEAQGITAAEAALALLAAQALAGLKTREVAAQTLRKLASGSRLSEIVVALTRSRYRVRAEKSPS